MRTKIYNSTYWKEHCFGLSAETLVDKAVELKCVGGMYSGLQKPTHFICLILKMLQIQPDKEIIIEFIKNEDYKYVRLLGKQHQPASDRVINELYGQEQPCNSPGTLPPSVCAAPYFAMVAPHPPSALDTLPLHDSDSMAAVCGHHQATFTNHACSLPCTQALCFVA